jgi:hypothetical protein
LTQAETRSTVTIAMAGKYTELLDAQVADRDESRWHRNRTVNLRLHRFRSIENQGTALLKVRRGSLCRAVSVCVEGKITAVQLPRKTRFHTCICLHASGRHRALVT